MHRLDTERERNGGREGIKKEWEREELTDVNFREWNMVVVF